MTPNIVSNAKMAVNKVTNARWKHEYISFQNPQSRI